MYCPLVQSGEGKLAALVESAQKSDRSFH